MTFHPFVQHEPGRPKKAAAATGNAVFTPETFVLAAGEYSQSVGFGGMENVILIKNNAVASDADDFVDIETSPDQTFAAAGIVTDEYGTVPFASIPVGQAVMIWSAQGANMFWRVRNRTTGTSIEVYYWQRPYRA